MTRVPPACLRLPARSGRPPRRLVVVLHGVGADKHDLEPVGAALAAAFPDDEVLLPDGHEELDASALGRQWFSRVGITDENRPARVGAAARDVAAWIDGELRARGLPRGALVVVGFSQGAIVGMDLALRLDPPPAAVVAIAGRFAVEAAALPATPRATRVLLLHGADDAIIPAAASEEAEAALRPRVATLQRLVFDGLGHGIDGRMLDAATRFLRAS